MVINEAFGWAWVVLGFVTGAMLGMGFSREGFLGGYDSWPRPLVRLGHIALVALGVLNILFAQSVARVELGEGWVWAASVSLMVGGVLMPLCCAMAAWRRGCVGLFAAPVAALAFGATVTTVGLAYGALS
jgi:hypothetical protein